MRGHRHQRLRGWAAATLITGKPTLAQWLALLDDVAARRRDDGVALVAFDTIASLLPGNDTNCRCPRCHYDGRTHAIRVAADSAVPTVELTVSHSFRFAG